MVVKFGRFSLLGIFLVVGVLMGLGLVSAWVDCMSFEEMNGGTADSCYAAEGCVVTSDDGTVFGFNSSNVVVDPFCSSDYSNYCCLPKMCWQWDATDQSTCETNDNTLNCTWNGFSETFYLMNGSEYTVNGTCHGNWDAMGDDSWGGVSDGCWQNDGNKQVCMNSENQQKCSWKENDQNQNPWCGVKTLGDALMKNSGATSIDIGCCEQKGCWSYDGNESQCMSDGTFSGLCTYVNKTDDPWCPNPEGCCYAKSCYEIGDNETLCNSLKMDMMMPCVFNESNSGICEDMGGGGFMFFEDSDSCFNQGGWYNSTGDCVMPSGDFGAGAGGFMFGGGAHCWFADNQPLVCGNITGCAYCVEGDGPNGVDNSSNNICSGVQVGWCEGHVAGDITYDNADNSDDLACSHIQIKSACNYGPLPNCVWNSSANLTGAFCAPGASSVVKSAPPVGFCEHPDSKNNYTLCTQLIEEFMMPCVWDNSSTIVKNCTFNPGAVFGSGGETDLGMVGSDTACTAAGGTWQTEYYLEDDILKQDSWCEMTGFFSVDNGAGEGNKGNCDTSCWACEFKYDGSDWENGTVAQSACVGSALGYCAWTNDSNSFNGKGWCDYPTEMESGGAKDCNFECEGCNFMNNPESACLGSVVDCKWVDDDQSAINGSCVDTSKKVCDSDCFSCYDSDNCYNSNVSCSWDNDFALCKPMGYEGEVCFNGVDDDGDGMVDCGDPDCGFDNFCGGSVFGGDCFAQINEGDCNTTFAFELGGDDLNCTWVTNDWDSEGHCDMPGSNCWQYDSDLVACGAIPGCTNDSSNMMMGGNSMCDINMTKVDASNCWGNNNESVCSGDCQWVNDSWCETEEAAGNEWCNSTGGWCDFKPFATCMSLNSTSCGANSNCTWHNDGFSMTAGEEDGWCDVACFNPDWLVDECENVSLGGLCEYRNMSETCQPEIFMMMGMGGGGKSGCWQYDGNETGCGLNSFNCQYKNDSYANNNKSVTEPAGWCMDKAEFEHFGDMKGDVIELAMDAGNSFGQNGPENESGVSGEVDLIGMGMRVTDNGFNFGAGVYNISSALVCNGYMVGAGMSFDGSVNEGDLGEGDATTKFYWYLDTNGNESDGCIAYGGSNSSGYEFMISYISSNETGSIVETKKLMKCGDDGWVSTNVMITTSKQMSCGEIGGVMVAVEKQGLESFAEYDKTANMRIFMASSNGSDSRTDPSDYIGPGYYTPGMIDFGFVDCSNPNTKDPKCKNMQKFGFNVFEECMNGVDDDENGLVDCYDPMCLFTPKCAELLGLDAFAFAIVDGDKTAPTVMFSEVDVLSDAAFMKIDTNEPSSLNVTFYHNDSTCSVEDTVLSDVGDDAYQAYAKFKPFHSVDLMDDNLNNSLENGTTYYYKIKVCDPSDNCAVSACSNFTTESSDVAKQFIFKLDLPDGYTVDIPALNETSYNFTKEFGGVVYDVGIKTNTSVTKNMNFTVHSNCGSGMSIGFYGVNIFEPTKIDLSNAFICDEDTNMMGMNSSLKKWDTLIDEMHLGGASDYIQIEMPVAYNSANTFNFVDDGGLNPQDVDDYVNCSGTTTTVCKVPVSLGF